jgi:hypothetical protein
MQILIRTAIQRPQKPVKIWARTRPANDARFRILGRLIDECRSALRGRTGSATNRSRSVMARIPLAPVHPERICWGCSKYCPADALRCGNGTERTMHPVELFGDDWLQWAEAGRNPGDRLKTFQD